jgi:hypothetical protein
VAPAAVAHYVEPCERGQRPAASGQFISGTSAGELMTLSWKEETLVREAQLLSTPVKHVAYYANGGYPLLFAAGNLNYLHIFRAGELTPVSHFDVGDAPFVFNYSEYDAKPFTVRDDPRSGPPAAISVFDLEMEKRGRIWSRTSGACASRAPSRESRTSSRSAWAASRSSTSGRAARA